MSKIKNTKERIVRYLKERSKLEDHIQFLNGEKLFHSTEEIAINEFNFSHTAFPWRLQRALKELVDEGIIEKIKRNSISNFGYGYGYRFCFPQGGDLCRCRLVEEKENEK